MVLQGLYINPRSGIPIFRQLVDQVRTLIVSGALKGGEQLTAVRALAEQLGVTPTTVSKAYGLLEVEGLIERRRGTGMFVREDDPTAIHESRKKIVTDEVTQAIMAARLIKLSRQEWDAIVDAVWTKVITDKEDS
jgi:GntR family transcriptional regulator